MADEPEDETGEEEGEAVAGGVAEGGASLGAEAPILAAAAVGPTVPPATPDEAIAGLKMKIDRLGPVNMMAIDQFDELETRHTFLTVQPKDLPDSIAAPGQAIKPTHETANKPSPKP